MKTIYPLSAALPGGPLHSLDYELTKNSNLAITNDGVNITISGILNHSWDRVLQILSEGGEILDYIVVLKVPIAFLTFPVPKSMPGRLKPTPDGTAIRQINEWLTPENVWLTETHFYFLSINVSGTNLKASEVKLLDNVPGVDVLLSTDPEYLSVL